MQIIRLLQYGEWRWRGVGGLTVTLTTEQAVNHPRSVSYTHLTLPTIYSV